MSEWNFWACLEGKITLMTCCNFRFLWPCIVSKLWSERENQHDATVRCLLSTLSQHVSGIIMPIFRRTRRITACGVLRWFCWMWLVAVVGRCVVGCEHCEGYCSTSPYNAAPHNRYQPHPAEPAQHSTCSNTSCSPEDGHNDARNMLRQCW